MRKFLNTALILVLLGAFVAPASAFAAMAEAGKVTRLQNKAEILRGSQTLPLEKGTAIRVDDRISTGPNARVEITLRDETKLTIGENSELVIDKYLFEPEKGIGTAIINAAKGPFRFITGQIGKMKNKKVEVHNPVGTIGIRGTDFWGGPSRGVYGVLLLEGAIAVFTDAGGRLVTAAGDGVNLTTSDALPSDPAAWAKPRVDEAIATVTFK